METSALHQYCSLEQVLLEQIMSKLRRVLAGKKTKQNSKTDTLLLSGTYIKDILRLI